MAPTDCEYFSETQVPTVDREEPSMTFDGIYVDGDYVDAAINGQTLHRDANPSDEFLIVSAGMDSGGVARIEIWDGSSVSCSSFGFENGKLTEIVEYQESIAGAPSLVDNQSGQASDTVSTGLWTAHQIARPDPGKLCRPGSVLRGYTYYWSTRATDFHGNVRQSAGHRIRFY